SEPSRSGLEFVRCGCAFFFERESLVLFDQSLALATQSFVLITILHGSEVLLGCKHKPTSQYQTTEQQQREPRQSSGVATATNFCVLLIFRESLHGLYIFRHARSFALRPLGFSSTS